MRTGNVTYEHGNNSSGSAVWMEERVMKLENTQKDIMEMINDMIEDFQATLDIVRNEIAKVNLTM